jgi:hypothetical protein
MLNKINKNYIIYLVLLISLNYEQHLISILSESISNTNYIKISPQKQEEDSLSSTSVCIANQSNNMIQIKY